MIRALFSICSSFFYILFIYFIYFFIYFLYIFYILFIYFIYFYIYLDEWVIPREGKRFFTISILELFRNFDCCSVRRYFEKIIKDENTQSSINHFYGIFMRLFFFEIYRKVQFVKQFKREFKDIYLWSTVIYIYDSWSKTMYIWNLYFYIDFLYIYIYIYIYIYKTEKYRFYIYIVWKYRFHIYIIWIN